MLLRAVEVEEECEIEIIESNPEEPRPIPEPLDFDSDLEEPRPISEPVEVDTNDSAAEMIPIDPEQETGTDTPP